MNVDRLPDGGDDDREHPMETPHRPSLSPDQNFLPRPRPLSRRRSCQQQKSRNQRKIPSRPTTPPKSRTQPTHRQTQPKPKKPPNPEAAKNTPTNPLRPTKTQARQMPERKIETQTLQRNLRAIFLTPRMSLVKATMTRLG